MHVAMIIDEERLEHEQSMLNRISIGLMAEGTQLTRIIPSSMEIDVLDEGEQRIALATRLVAPMRVLPWMRPARAMRLAEAMEKSRPDVIFAVGEQAWNVGADLSQVIERPLVLDVCSLEQAHAVGRLLAKPSTSAAGCIVPSRGLYEILQSRFTTLPVTVAPIGIAPPPQPREAFNNLQQTIAIAVVGQARVVSSYFAMLMGLSRAVAMAPQLQIFLELHGPREHEIWQKLHSSDLLQYVSTFGDASSYRSLLTRCDLMLIPEGDGELRSFIYEAMALAMPVIAYDDPIKDGLIDNQTVKLVHKPSSVEWATQIEAMLQNPQQARALGLRAREHVLAHNRSSEQVAKVHSALETAAAASTFRISQHQS